MPNLKTCFCHGCGAFMECPYQSPVDQELYHKFCLPNSEALKFADEEYAKYMDRQIDNFQDRLNQEWRQPNDSKAES